MKATCDHTGKVSFRSRTEAMRALLTIKGSAERKGADGKRIKHRCLKPRQKRVYYCNYCGGYHLTSWAWWLWKSAESTTAPLTHSDNQEIHDTLKTKIIPPKAVPNYPPAYPDAL